MLCVLLASIFSYLQNTIHIYLVHCIIQKKNRVKVIRYIKYKSSLHIVHTLSIYNMYKYDKKKSANGKCVTPFDLFPLADFSYYSLT